MGKKILAERFIFTGFPLDLSDLLHQPKLIPEEVIRRKKEGKRYYLEVSIRGAMDKDGKYRYGEIEVRYNAGMSSAEKERIRSIIGSLADRDSGDYIDTHLTKKIK